MQYALGYDSAIVNLKIYPLLYENNLSLLVREISLICKSCSWYATCLTSLINPNTCPLRGNIEIESVPLRL